MSRHNVGDRVRLWKPGHCEHGMQAVVKQVITIQEYYGDDYTPAVDYRGPHAYIPTTGWRDEAGQFFCGGPLPDAMVASEEFYQTAKHEYDRA